MSRMVLLQHTLPDGSSHYDWMIAPPIVRQRSALAGIDPEARELITFRVEERIDLPRVKAFDAVHLPNHRRLYLTFEGDIGPAQPGGPSRGVVKRVARGMLTRFIELADGSLEIRGAFGPRHEALWRGKPADARGGAVIWAFTCEPAPQPRRPGSKALDEYSGYDRDFMDRST